MNYEETLEYLYKQLPVFQQIGSAAYKYRATAMSGKTVRGNLVASDPEALLNELKKQDLFLLDYTQTNKTSFGSKLKPKELTDFCRQLGSLLDAGV